MITKKLMFIKSKFFFKWFLGLPIKGCIQWIKLLKRFSPQFAYKLIDSLLEFSDNQTIEVKHLNNKKEVVLLGFNAPNSLCRYRVSTFSSKEPETLRWIDENKHLGNLFDIGANVGIYSIYFAKQSKHDVVAFEPSPFNLPSLVRNINLNKLSQKVTVFSHPLFSTNTISKFNLSDDMPAGAHNSFGVNYNSEGLKQDWSIFYNTVGFSLDYLIENGILPSVPSLIKIDVDGIEHLILAGAKKTLSHKKCQTVLVEVNNDFEEQKKSVENLLLNSGFEISGASSNQLWADQNVKNYIWHKSDKPS